MTSIQIGVDTNGVESRLTPTAADRSQLRSPRGHGLTLPPLGSDARPSEYLMASRNVVKLAVLTSWMSILDLYQDNIHSFAQRLMAAYSHSSASKRYDQSRLQLMPVAKCE